MIMEEEDAWGATGESEYAGPRVTTIQLRLLDKIVCMLLIWLAHLLLNRSNDLPTRRGIQEISRGIARA